MDRARYGSALFLSYGSLTIDLFLSPVPISGLNGGRFAKYIVAPPHEIGADVPRDPERARQLFQLCASSGYDLCQYRLGRLLLQRPDRAEHQYLQGLAWLSLAAGNGVKDANVLLEPELSTLTPDQRQWVDRLKERLRRR